MATPRAKRVMAPTPPIQRPTRRQLEVLCAYIAAGSIAAAAYELGISETTARQHLSGLYRRTGCLNAAQAAYLLGTRQLDSDATIVTSRVSIQGCRLVASERTMIRPDGCETDEIPTGAVVPSTA